MALRDAKGCGDLPERGCVARVTHSIEEKDELLIWGSLRDVASVLEDRMASDMTENAGECPETYANVIAKGFRP